MPSFKQIAGTIVAATLAISTPLVAQSPSDDARFDAAQRRFDSELANFRAEYDRYLASRDNRRGGYRDQRGDRQGGYYDDRDEGNYDAAGYYRSGPNYQERVLTTDDRVYRGSDGRYYCKRNDGTTGLIVGAAAGGILGNVIDGGHSRTVGTLLGGAVGALAGRSIDQNSSQVRCR